MFKPLYAFPSLLFHTYFLSVVFDKDIALFVYLHNRILACTSNYFLQKISLIYANLQFIHFVLTVGCSIIIFFLIGEPYERGFFCNDEDLMHPYHKSTVKHWMLFVFGIIVPIVIVSTSFCLEDWLFKSCNFDSLRMEWI